MLRNSGVFLAGISVMAALASLAPAGASPTSGPIQSGARAEPAREEDHGKPMIVLFQQDPWLQVVGSDPPTFVLYEDGTAIFARTSEDARPKYFSVKVCEKMRKELFQSLAGLATAKKNYQTVWATCQPHNVLWIKIPGLEKRIFVYGRLKPETYPPFGKTERLPVALQSAFDKLSEFEHPEAKPWLPKNIEVMIWPFEYSKDKPLDWPAKWPDLKIGKKVLDEDDNFSVLIPSSDLDELRALLRSRKPTTAIRIGGHKWSVSYRFPFPREELLQHIRTGE